MENDSLRNQISDRVLRITRTFTGVLQCQTAARTIAEPVVLIAAIAAFGEILSRMRAKLHSARYAALPCWLITGSTARTGTRVPAIPLARSILPAFTRTVTGAFPGTG